MPENLKRLSSNYQVTSKSIRKKMDQRQRGENAYILVLMFSHMDMVQKLQILSDWEDVDSKQDAIQLLTKIQDLSHNHDEAK